MEAIILAGKPAAGKTTVAKIISEKLHIRVIGGGDILKEMAAERGYSVSGEGWWDTDEGIKFLKEREGNPNFDNDADRRLMKRIEEGDIVVTSWTAAWISKSGYKVWLEGSEKTRAERMEKRDNMSFKESLQVLRIRDSENQSLYMKMYKIDIWKDKAPFDLIVDTNSKAPEEIADIIIKKFEKNKKR